MMSWPSQVVTPVVGLPKSWMPCPICGRHFVVRKRAHLRICALVLED